MFEDILSKVRSLRDRFRRDGSVAWYRGHRRTEWPLKSTLHRHIERLIESSGRTFPESDCRELLREEYKTIYRHFKTEAWPLLSDQERSDWGVIFTMQHYRLPTRLLDWTENFACALFFAQYGREPGESSAIWVLDPEALNEITVGRRGQIALDEDPGEGPIEVRHWHPKWKGPTSELPTLAVRPIYTNPRMTAQKAAFALAGDSFLTLDKQCERLVVDERLVKIELPPTTFAEIDHYLMMAGLDAFSFFPDLEGLALKHEAQTLATIRDTQRFFPGGAT